MRLLKRFATTILVPVIGIPLLIALSFIFREPACHVPFCSPVDVLTFFIIWPALVTAEFLDVLGIPSQIGGIAVILITIAEFALAGLCVDFLRQRRLVRRTQ